MDGTATCGQVSVPPALIRLGVAVVRLRLSASHRHILPILVLYLPVVGCINLGMGMDTSRGFGMVIYSCQVLLSIAVFYFALMVNLFDLTQPREGLLRHPRWAVRLLRVSAPYLTYLMFLFRIMMLCAMEAMSVVLLVGVWLLGVAIDSPLAQCWGLSLAVVFALAHFWCERKRLGKNAVCISAEEDGD